MRKVLSIIIICCIGFTLAGYYPVFIALQRQTRQEIKHRIKQGVPEDEIHKIVFAKGEPINWVRPAKEFRLKGEMFDVVRKEILQDSIILYCINDKQEKSLFTALDELVSNELNDEQSSKGKTTKLLSKIFSQQYISTASAVIPFYSFYSEVFFVYWASSQQCLAVPNSPPPDLL